MKLLELEPQLVASTPEEGLRYVQGLQEAQGVMFKCPGCLLKNGGLEGTHLVLAWFRNPRELPPVPPGRSPGPGRWDQSGSGLADLTLRPSIQVSCWHGFITAGEVSNA